ncbi:hypothetical protein POM88_010441 [Heracleum sosnowskyi]|uniref:Uncharacterized protein n=1 Tax=Heracleum sosnowskyi TaxID=360622 RepID=A0AAD8IT55_9APIA|nr:hypothetical protein POM88_010441 [Heracleum sosnowskyi]
MEEESKKKLKIFLHVLEPNIINSGTVSNIYQLEMDANILENSSIESYDAKKPSSSSLPKINPIFSFLHKVKFYPEGMSCVLLGSKLYFMGGSLTYTADLLGLSCYDMDYREYENGFDEPINNFLNEQLENYPRDVSVFDCDTCQLLPDDSCLPKHSGKYPNPLTFVANDQIFVLSLKKVHKDMITFESMKPGHGWEKLTPPPPFFLFRSNHPVGSALIKDNFLLTFSTGRSNIILSYNIISDEWTLRESYHLPQLFLGSIFVQDTLYTAVREPLRRTYFKYNSPVLSFGPLKSTTDVDGTTLDYVAVNRSRKVSDFGENSSICYNDIRNWPIHVNEFGFATRCFLHLGGLLKGTEKTSRFFGFVELFNPFPGEYEDTDTQSELRFVAFEALPNKNSANVDAEFHARTIHSSHFSTDIFGTGCLNAACAYLA